MVIGITLIIVLISIGGMVLVAWKWNILNPSVLTGGIIVALLAAVPFLSVYERYGFGWLTLLGALAQISISFVAALGLILYHFFRDPERHPPEEKHIVVSPADGELIYIYRLKSGSTPIVTKNGHDFDLHELAGVELDPCGMLILGIEMNILNVHVNRCPIEGRVRLVKHIEGGFLSLRKQEAPFINARCTTHIVDDALSIVVVQIASRLVRRVNNYLQVSQTVGLGQRLGMIRFGSQVAVILPDREDIHLEVKLGQKVLAGTTILARYRKNG